jgi:phosphopantothenoylcysteine decarboxylase/phosphopantothenate--cysteine ligase
MPNPINQKNILLGVTGSIAAYKAAELASRLHQSGAMVNVFLTQSAEKFVSPLTFQSVTGRKCYTDADLWGGEGHVVHVQLGHSADLLLIAPASANTIAKLTHGIADNLVSITALAASCPIFIAPAMDAGMYSHTATQANIKVLQERGVTFIGPEVGHLASGLEGLGRMTEPAEIINQIRWRLAQNGPLKGKKVVVAAGGTKEPIDPVRVLSNRSSGKQGYALAQAALDAGAQVVLISTPTALTLPTGAQVIAVQTAEEMRLSVLAQINDAHALLMAAAVADFRPSKVAAEKIKKDRKLTSIELKTTADILMEVARVKPKVNPHLRVVGFAAESEQLLKNARKKMEGKKLDMIVANDITAPQAGFGTETNQVILLFADGKCEELPLLPKNEVAEKIIEYLISWFSS